MKEIVIIGSGNVATHLALGLFGSGNKIVCVYSRNEKNAEALAKEVNAKATKNLQEIPTAADLYLLAVKDDAISEVSESLSVQGVVAHTSGITDINALKKHKCFGVFYPLQTFRKEVEIDLKQIPFLIEASDNETVQFLKNIASQLSEHVFETNTQSRQTAHLAAVFANNFTNHLFDVAQQILQQNNLPFDMLKPIILQTAMNVQTHLPQEVQTGAAARGDEKTIEAHLKLLNGNPQYKRLYELLTKSIIEKK